MVAGKYQLSGSVAEGGTLAFSSRCLSRRNGFSRTHMSAATRNFSFPRVFLASLSQKKLAEPSEPSSTAKLPSRKTFLESTVDKDGYLCSPRAARELAFSILYAARLLGEKPMHVFRDRLKQQSGYLAKDLLASYKHAPDVGGSIIVDDVLIARKIKAEQLRESMLEAAVLSAPPTKVYNRSILMRAQEIIQATSDSWSEHEIILSDLLPKARKEGGGYATTQQCILHMAMAEMTKCGTPPKVVISEAVELGKRFMDMRTSATINGCLRMFVRSAYYKDTQIN